jgi:hypothetical protein
MTDEQFKALCNTYGFAPSRALRELIDCAVARQEILEEVTAQRDALLEALKLIVESVETPTESKVFAMRISKARAVIKKAEGEKA